MVETFEITVVNEAKTFYLSIFFGLLLITALAGSIFDRPHGNFYEALLATDIVIVCGIAFGFSKFLTDRKSVALYADKICITNNEVAVIVFNDIKEYKINKYQDGLTLYVNLNSGEKVILNANRNLGEIVGMKTFVIAFTNAIDHLIGLGEISTARRETNYGVKWYFASLIFGTASCLTAFVGQAIHKHQVPPLRFWLAIGIFIAIWAAYFNAKRKNG